MTLSVKDIMNDLGVMNITVWRWIKEGKIKATMRNRRIGWKIEEEDYVQFLEKYPRWRLVHNGDVFRNNEIRVRNDVLVSVLSKMISLKSVVKGEGRNEEYRTGFNRAIDDITGVINEELRRKIPDNIDSRAEQMA